MISVEQPLLYTDPSKNCARAGAGKLGLPKPSMGGDLVIDL
jgi:hypothetical protein